MPSRTEALIDHLTRTRVPVALYRSMAWFKALDADRQHEFETRIGICCGDGEVTVTAYAVAKMEVENNL